MTGLSILARTTAGFPRKQVVKTYLLHNVHGTGYLVKMVRHSTLHNRAVFHTNWCWNLPFYKIRGEENTTTIISDNRNRYYSKHKLMDHYYKYQKLPILRSRCWCVWNDWMCGILAQMLRVQRQHFHSQFQGSISLVHEGFHHVQGRTSIQHASTMAES